MAATSASNIPESLTAILRESDSPTGTEAAEAPTKEETATSEEGAEAAGHEERDTDGKPAKGKNLQGRFNEFTTKLKESQSRIAELEKTLQERDVRNQKLVDLVATKEEELKYGKQALETMRALQNLARENDTARSYVENLDKMLNGLEVQATELEDKSTPEADKQATEVRKAISELQRERESFRVELADQQSDILADRSRAVIDQYLEALPPEYSDHDKDEIYDRLVKATNWEVIEEGYKSNPQVIPQEISKALTNVFGRYGKPRGAYESELSALQEQIKQYEQAVPKERVLTAPDEVKKKILGIEWGKVERDAKGKPKERYSDGQFSEALAEMMRQDRRSG